jgi:hypothetical protein
MTLALFPEKWITECGSKLIYELLPNKEVLYVVPVTSILGKLPVVRAGDTGTIPHKYRSAFRLGQTADLELEMDVQCFL